MSDATIWLDVRDGKRTVAVWRDGWLPRSEAFLVNQMSAMRHWSPVPVGLFRFKNGLAVEPALAPWGEAGVQRVLRWVFASHIHRRDFRRALQRSDARIIHAQFGIGGIHAAPVARALGLPLVVTFHGHDACSYPSRRPFSNRIYRVKLRRLFAQAHTLIAVSEYVAGLLRSAGAPAEKVRVLHIGIPLPEEPPSLGPSRSGILFVGRLIPLKGASDMLRAVSSLPARLRSVEVTVVGDGPERGALEEEAASLGLNVTFTGWLPPEEVADRMHRAAVLCAPSHADDTGRTEGFGLVYLEAALYGLPVVAYASGGVLEAVVNGSTGILVEERDLDALSGALSQLIDEEETARSYGGAGQRRVLEEFSLVRQTRRLESLYDAAAAADT